MIFIHHHLTTGRVLVLIQEWYLRVDSSSCESNDVLEIKNASILIDKIVLKRDYFISVIAKKGNVHHFKKAAWKNANVEIYL